MARWQPIAVLAGLAAPPVALAVLVWPASAPAGGSRDGEVEATLSAGDAADGSVSGTLSRDYEIVGDGGPVRITVAGIPGFDATLTLIDPDSGDQIGFNDDASDGNRDAELTVELGPDETVIAEVRSLGGAPGDFTISVEGLEGGAVAPTTVGGVRVEPATTGPPEPAVPVG